MKITRFLKGLCHLYPYKKYRHYNHYRGRSDTIAMPKP
jgi:hypothetical protein